MLSTGHRGTKCAAEGGERLYNVTCVSSMDVATTGRNQFTVQKYAIIVMCNGRVLLYVGRHVVSSLTALRVVFTDIL